jgi:hypothetical protein
MRENPNFITSVITSTTKRDSAASMSARMMAMGFQGVRDFCVTKGSLLPPSFDSPEDLLHRHCQSKFVYFATTSEPDFVAIDFPTFFRSI